MGGLAFLGVQGLLILQDFDKDEQATKHSERNIDWQPDHPY